MRFAPVLAHTCVGHEGNGEVDAPGCRVHHEFGKTLCRGFRVGFGHFHNEFVVDLEQEAGLFVPQVCFVTEE
mgnify:CR=1 FL=1